MTKRPFFDNVIAFFFLLAGLYNVVGILYPTQFFTDQTLATIDPVVFSWFGQVSIVLWGLAYWSIAFSFYKVPKLIFVFFVEKLLYVGVWAFWLFNHTDMLPQIASQNQTLAMFFQYYGAGDLLFALFFFAVMIRCSREPKVEAVPNKTRIEPQINTPQAEKAENSEAKTENSAPTLAENKTA